MELKVIKVPQWIERYEGATLYPAMTIPLMNDTTPNGTTYNHLYMMDMFQGSNGTGGTTPLLVEGTGRDEYIGESILFRSATISGYAERPVFDIDTQLYVAPCTLHFWIVKVYENDWYPNMGALLDADYDNSLKLARTAPLKAYRDRSHPFQVIWKQHIKWRQECMIDTAVAPSTLSEPNIKHFKWHWRPKRAKLRVKAGVVDKPKYWLVWGLAHNEDADIAQEAYFVSRYELRFNDA